MTHSNTCVPVGASLAMERGAKAEVTVELERKFGFAETKGQRETRIREEKQQKWRQRLERENLDKLQKELESLRRAEFLTPPQRERKRYVEKAVHDLLSQQLPNPEKPSPAEAQGKPSCASEPTGENDSDDDGEVFGVSIADTFGGATDVGMFVPRSVKVRRVEKTAKTSDCLDSATAAEQEILSAFAKGDDGEFDAFLDSL